MSGIDDIPCTRGSGQPEPGSTGADLSPSKPRQRTLRFRLSCLVLACVLPVWATSAFLVYHSYLQERNLTEQRVMETTRALSMVVDRELTGMRTSVTALGYLALPHFGRSGGVPTSGAGCPARFSRRCRYRSGC